MKQTGLTVADEIEISLRSGNREKQGKLDVIIANCNFAIANSDNDGLKQFAQIVINLANQNLS